WSSDVCSSDLAAQDPPDTLAAGFPPPGAARVVVIGVPPRPVRGVGSTHRTPPPLGVEQRLPLLRRHLVIVADRGDPCPVPAREDLLDRKSTRLNSSHVKISYA